MTVHGTRGTSATSEVGTYCYAWLSWSGFRLGWFSSAQGDGRSGQSDLSVCRLAHSVVREKDRIGFRSSFSGRTRWADVKAMLGMESWAQKPTCRGPAISPGAPPSSTLRVEREGPSPLSQANRVARPGPGSCRQQLFSDLSSHCSAKYRACTGQMCSVLVQSGQGGDKVHCMVHAQYMAIT